MFLSKTFKFTPSEELWYSFQQYMKGEMVYNDFKSKWTREESNVDVELKGFEYLYEVVPYFTPLEVIIWVDQEPNT